MEICQSNVTGSLYIPKPCGTNKVYVHTYVHTCMVIVIFPILGILVNAYRLMTNLQEDKPWFDSTLACTQKISEVHNDTAPDTGGVSAFETMVIEYREGQEKTRANNRSAPTIR